MKVVFAFFFIICLVQSAWYQTQPAKSHGFPFRVHVSINEASLKTDLYRRRGVFFVDTTVTNISSKDQRIIVWTQQGWSWLSNNANITPGTEATQNNATKITLKPAQAYKGYVEMFIFPHKTKPITFRLGFFPNAEIPISDQPGFASLHRSEIVWSDVVTLIQ